MQQAHKCVRTGVDLRADCHLSRAAREKRQTWLSENREELTNLRTENGFHCHPPQSSGEKRKRGGFTYVEIGEERLSQIRETRAQIVSSEKEAYASAKVTRLYPYGQGERVESAVAV